MCECVCVYTCMRACVSGCGCVVCVRVGCGCGWVGVSRWVSVVW